ncbi:MAG: hypothetical protein ACR5LA_07640 [Wolbachia sp.]
MPGRLLHVKDTVLEKGLINKEKRNRWISIESELQDVEQNRTIYFLLGGGDLKLSYVCILGDSSYRILIARGEIMRAPREAFRKQLVKIRLRQSLANSLKRTIMLRKVTNVVKLMERTIQGATKVKVLSSEISDIIEVDIVHFSGRQHEG